MPAKIAVMSHRKAALTWLAVAVCIFCYPTTTGASEKAPAIADPAAAICPVVYPLDQDPSEKGYHYLFYGNAFFVNEDGYLITAAHLMHSFRDGGQPHLLVELPTGQRRLLKAEVVATDWEHDVAVLRATPNPFEGGYRVAFLPLATDRLAPGKSVVSVSLRPSSLEEANTFEEPLEERSDGEVLSYQYTRTANGREIELLLYSQKVIPGQSGSPISSKRFRPHCLLASITARRNRWIAAAVGCATPRFVVSGMIRATPNSTAFSISSGTSVGRWCSSGDG